MAKVLIVNSSPRKNSNTRCMAEKVTEGAQTVGHSVTTIEIGKAALHPCIGCQTCHDKTPGKCVFDDAMTAFYSEINQADTILFASPIYYFTVNAQAKLFIDRLFALGASAFTTKQVGGIFAYGGEDPVDSGCINAIRMFQDICSYTSAKWIGTVYGSAWHEGDAGKNTALQNKAREFGAGLQ